MTAKDYNVQHPYGATYSPWSSNSPHRGNDRPTPSGTAIVINGTTIGLTGATGDVSGPHLHTQAGTDANCQNTLNPSPYEFKPGTVTRVGTASEWGNFVIIKVGTHYICYAHLSEISVSVGQVIKEVNVNGEVSDGDVINGKRGSTQVKDYQPTGSEFDFYKRPENGMKRLFYDTLQGMQVEIDNRNQTIKQLSSGVTYEQVGTINGKPVFQQK